MATSSAFLPPDEIERRVGQVLSASIADETEVVWVERRRGYASRPGSPRDGLENRLRTVLVRVVEAGRLGWFRTETAEPNELENGVRQAIALSRVQPAVRREPLLPSGAEGSSVDRALRDSSISTMAAPEARDWLAQLPLGDDESVRLSWSDSRLVIENSHGLRRRAATTEVTLTATSGKGPGRGLAAGSARRRSDLDLTAILERSRRYRASAEPAAPPRRGIPVWLAPEATIELLHLLNLYGFSGRSFVDGSSFLARHRNVQVFDRSVHLRDDGTDRSGLPFPFDLEGSPKAPLDLIVDGTPTTPALDRYLGSQAALEPTAQAIGGLDSLFGNLFLDPGEAGEDRLLDAARGGIRIAALDSAQCFDPTQLWLRAVARGVRRVDEGGLGPPLPDLRWEVHLLGALARLAAIGSDRLVLAKPSTPLGGISAPSLILAEADAFTPLADEH